jgi:hypothetical protein
MTYFKKYLVIFLIGLSCTAVAAAGTITGCGGDESAPANGDTDNGDDTDGETIVDPVAKDIAFAIAKIATAAALRIGLGVRTDEEQFEVHPVYSPCGVEPIICEYNWGMNTQNCPENCTTRDGVCDTSENPENSFDCKCGNGRCDEYGGESSETCPEDCICGDDVCSQEELYKLSCPADCESLYEFHFGGPSIPLMNGIPTYKCDDPLHETHAAVHRIFSYEGDARELVSAIEGSGVCEYGHKIDDPDEKVIFIDSEINIDTTVDGFKFECVQETYDGNCAEVGILLIPKSDGTWDYHITLAGKVYVTRDDPPEAYIIISATANGWFTPPPPEEGKTCLDYDYKERDLCVEAYKYEAVALTIEDADISHYDTATDEVVHPTDEACSGFQLEDFEAISAATWLGPDNPALFTDWDGDGNAGCTDVEDCSDNQFCQYGNCPLGIESLHYNAHSLEIPCDPCGNNVCAWYEELLNSYCEEDCCGNGVCKNGVEIGPVIYCKEDCCGDGICSISVEDPDICPEDCHCGNGICEPEKGENAGICPQDCDACGDGVCGKSEGVASCPADCVCGDGICDQDEASHPDYETYYCPDDCCGDGLCHRNEANYGLCPGDCPDA